MRRAKNDDLTFTLIFWGAIVVVGLFAWWISVYRKKKRAAALERVAQELGLEYASTGTEDFVAGFGPFQIFSRGRAQKAYNLMQGATGDRGLAIFDHQFTTGHGKSTKVWRYTVLCIRFDGPAIPTFQVRPENLGDKIVGWFRGNDIDFDTHPEFSKRFLLNGEDEAAVRDLFTPQVLEYFEAKKTLSAEAIGQTLLIYRQGKVPPQQIGDLLAEGLEVLALFNRTG
jgi:hypothetical protein